MWIYSSGFPKSQDIGKSIQRSMGVKETKKVLDNGRARMANKLAETNNLGDAGFSGQTTICTDPEAKAWSGWGTQLRPAHEPIALARKPIKTSLRENCLKYGTGALNIDATRVEGRFPSNVIGEIPDYQKYFYCPKVSRRERHLEGQAENNHPTVKPVELMKYLIKLVTPPGGTVLDPFNGSGSTGMASVELGHYYVGIDLDPKYIEISQQRITAWTTPAEGDVIFNQLFE
jgi:site-specific DNA-methyltransferase (adenine-specific)